MQPSNFHSHCTFCDGRSHPEDFIKFAIAQNFRAYGFSSHSPLPFATSWNMPILDMPEYFNEIKRLKKKYAGQIEIYLGMEIDYLDDTYNPSISMFRSLPLDFRIGSIHFLPWKYPLEEDNMSSIDCAYKDFEKMVKNHYRGDIRRVVSDFFRSTIDMIESGGFDIVGHLDKIYFNGCNHPGFDMTADWYQKPLTECIDLIAQKEYIVEINSKNFAPRQQIYPHFNVLKTLYDHHIPVMVNSDSHSPVLINSGRNEALTLLRAVGYQSTRELVDGTWQDVPIE
ncbi:MAG: histidinol-phosphatase [Tannerella sp.]|jgi:histidinol-phosphatase (PHP family)|nr:histidinol-phosphatase [Tannerella sp.]